MKRTDKNFAAFTLVELLVVIAIIVILSTLIIGGFRSSQRRSRDAARKSDLKQISNALEMIYSDHQRYPSSIDGRIRACLFIPNAAIPDVTSGDCAYGSTLSEDIMTDAETIYMREIPTDPAGGSYFYRSLDNGAGYQIFAHLENLEDQGCVKTACAEVTIAGVVLDCGEGACNYAATSPNVSPTD